MIQSEDFEAMGPFAEIRFRAYRAGRVARETRGDDKFGSGAQQFEAGLITDLDASAGQERNPAAQVGQFGTLHEIELRARWAHLVVEMVDDRILLLADVAMLQLVSGDVALFKSFGRKDVRRGENGPAAQRTNPCLVKSGVGALRPRGLPLALLGF